MKKWKKALSAFAVAAVMSVGMAATAGCGDDDVTPHEHTYKTEWTQGEKTHWHESSCEHTGLKSGEANHADTDNDGKCDACGYTMTVEHEHTWATVWSTSETKHWHAATCEGHTDQKKDEGDHVDTNSDGKCDTCEYVISSASTVDADLIDVSDLDTLSDGDVLKTGLGIKAVDLTENATGLVVEGNSGKKSTFAGEAVTPSKRLKLDQTVGKKALEVNLAKDATVLVYAYSGSAGAVRNLELYDSENAPIEGTSQSIGDGNNNVLGVAVFDVKKDTTYYIGAATAGINVYYIAVVYAGFEETWTSHAAVEADCTKNGNLAYSASDFGRYKNASGDIVAYNEVFVANLGGHNYSLKAGSIVVPTATAEGSAVLTCATGKEELSVTLPVLSSESYKERPAVDVEGTYKYVSEGVEITFTAVGVAVAEATYTPVLDLPSFTGVPVGTEATEGQDCIYATEGTVTVEGDGSLKIGDASKKTVAYLKLGTAINDGVVKISGTIKVGATNTNWTFFQLLNGEGKEVVAFRTGSGGAWGYRLGGSGNPAQVPVAANTSASHTYEILVDLENSTITIKVDDNIIADNVAYPEKTSDDKDSNALDSLGYVAFENINNGRYVTLGSLTVATKD